MLRLSDNVDSNRTVRDVLMDKHPSGQPTHPDPITKGDPPVVHSVLFESIAASMIRSAALRTTGAAGLSCLDAPAGENSVPHSNLHPMTCVIPLLSLLSVCARILSILQRLSLFWPAV